MTNERLPLTIKRLVDQQTTRPVTEVWDNDPEDQFSPYGTYYYRAIACMLLSERVQAKMDGHPNMTDVNRIGKEANFNQYLFDRVAKFLIGIEALKPDRRNAATWKGRTSRHSGNTTPTGSRPAQIEPSRDSSRENWVFSPGAAGRRIMLT